MGEQSFFGELKQFVRTVDRQVCQLKQEYEKEDRKLCYPVVNKEINDLKQRTRSFTKEVQDESIKLQDGRNTLDGLITSMTAFLKSQSEQLTKTEEHLKQYGFKTWGDVQAEKEAAAQKQTTEQEVAEANQETSKEQSEENSVTVSTTPQTKSEPKLNRTPQLEDVGISEKTLQFLNSCAKQKPPVIPKSVSATTSSTATPKQAISNIHEANAKYRPFDAGCVPSVFRHNGIITTPSLFGRLMDQTIDHTALLTPDPIKMERITQTELGNLSTKLIFEDDPCPVSPHVVSNDIELIPTGKKVKQEHCSQTQATNTVIKRPVNVGLFQSSLESIVKQEPAGNTHDLDDLPPEPELTYSLEALTEMTGMFQINQLKQPPTLESSLKYGNNKENVTPPEPELLSERKSRVKAPESPKVTGKKSSQLEGELPKTPTFLGKYNFM